MPSSTILGRLRTVLESNSKQFIAEMNSVNRNIKGLEKTFKGFARGLIGTFAAFEAGRILKDFVGDSINLAVELEGVENAFNRLNRPGLLANLRIATQGTLSDFKLMQAAVEFDNFRLPLDKLATLLKFVQLRANATGKSVEYLRDSLIEGLSKGSLLRLDNLGFKIVELKQKINDTGDITEAVTQLAQREIEKMGGSTDTAKTSVNRLSASWENLKTTIGSTFTQGSGKGALDTLSELLDKLNRGISSRFGSDLEKAQGEVDNLIEKIERLQSQKGNGLNKLFSPDFDSKIDEQVDNLVVQLKAARDRVKELKQAQADVGVQQKQITTDVEKEELTQAEINRRLRERQRLLTNIRELSRTDRTRQLQGVLQQGLDTVSGSRIDDRFIASQNKRLGEMIQKVKTSKTVTDSLDQAGQKFTNNFSSGLQTILGLFNQMIGKGNEATRLFGNALATLIPLALSTIPGVGPGISGVFSSILGQGSGSGLFGGKQIGTAITTSIRGGDLNLIIKRSNNRTNRNF